jgi:RNA polymerase sigma-70 factor (ECF subfamily)
VTDAAGRGSFDQLLAELRPKLHRYCARMTGSVVDGEDVLQETLVKAIEAFPGAGRIGNAEGWLFRIAHNAALDFLRRRARQEAAHSGEDPDMIVDATDAIHARQAAAASLSTFMRLPTAQRSSVVLMDVLGYSLEEISGVTDLSIPAVKAALHRGRARLRELAAEPDDRPAPVLSEPERTRLAAYVDRFNARDFDAVRDMLADEVRLELVARTRLHGKKEVSTYLTRYAVATDWQFVPGLVDRRPAIIVRDPGDPSGKPAYFLLLGWTDVHVATIRDFRHARYVTDGAEIVVVD